MKTKDAERFDRKAKELIVSYGGVLFDERLGRYELETSFGRLELVVRDNWAKRGKNGPGTVFTRFDDPDAAKRVVDCNPHSGKWNHHYFNGWTVEGALTDLKRSLDIVTCNEFAECAKRLKDKVRASCSGEARTTLCWSIDAELEQLARTFSRRNEG